MFHQTYSAGTAVSSMDEKSSARDFTSDVLRRRWDGRQDDGLHCYRVSVTERNEEWLLKPLQIPVARNVSKDIVYGYTEATVIVIRATCVFCLRIFIYFAEFHKAGVNLQTGFTVP